MIPDPSNQNLNTAESSIQNSQLAQAKRDVNIFNTIIPAVNQIQGKLASTFKWLGNMNPEKKHDYSSAKNLDKYRSMEEIAQERLELEKMDSDRRANAAERLEKLQKEEIKLKRWIFEENLIVTKEYQSNYFEQKSKEYELKKDRQYLPFQISRNDTLNLLSKEFGKFVIISSPPEVVTEERIFKSLGAEINHKLHQSIQQYYSGDIKYPISYQNIFKDSISDYQASFVGELVPTPTLIFHSQINNYKVFIYITITVPCQVESDKGSLDLDKYYDIKYEQESFLLPAWNWMELRKELESQEQDSQVINQKILDLITNFYIVIAICFSDVYCLNIDSYHNPKLFNFLKDSKFPEYFESWVEPLKIYLVETQKQVQKLKREEVIKSSSINRYNNDDLPYMWIVGIVIVMLIFAFCIQKSSNQNTIVQSTKTPTKHQQSQSGVIRVNHSDINAVYLRTIPNGKKISRLQNGTRIILGEISADGQWQKITTQDGKSGWVFAKYVQ